MVARQLRRRPPAQVHERLRTRGEHVVAADGSFADSRRPLAPLAAELAAPLELVKAHPADIVPGARIFASRVAEADDQLRHGDPRSGTGDLELGHIDTGQQLPGERGHPPSRSAVAVVVAETVEQ